MNDSNESNILLLTDSYKMTHARQYPPDTRNIHSYLESRVGATYTETVFFGLQAILMRYLEGRVVTREAIDEARSFARLHFGTDRVFDPARWLPIVEEHGGRLPVTIRAVPEGTAVPTGNVMMTIEATDERFYWLPNFLETILLHVWYPSTVATVSASVRRSLDAALERAGASAASADFMLHDFGFRGTSSVESAGAGGAAHLLSFQGTDTIEGVRHAMRYYDADVCGFSIPASEHSTITSWGEERELDAYANLLMIYPSGATIACVSDSYDIERACEWWGSHDALRPGMDARKRDGGRLVVRPDSGDPVESVLSCLQILGEHFEPKPNAAGFRVLPDHVRVIQGDGCTPESIDTILTALLDAGWSPENVAFGMGGGLLQRVDRDTQRFSFKASARLGKRQWHDVYKRPVSDPSKNSKRGRLGLVHSAATGYATVPFEAAGADNQLRVVFENGRFVIRETFETIRARRHAQRDGAADPASPEPIQV